MIIKSIKLQPFAGIKAREINFHSGLNVVLGPNESGKSTMVNAIKSALFVDTNLTLSKMKPFLSSYLPVDGGDTVHVILEFLFNNQRYLLEKIWGATKSSKLIHPSGSAITSNDEIKEKMQKILGLNQGTYENVLIVRQSWLSDTINTLMNDGQASETIQQILRNAAFATDGISVTKLKELVDSKVEEYYSRWDRKLNRPEGMRDVNNKWKQGANQGIIKAYYAYKDADNIYNEALEYELKIDDIVKKTASISAELSSLEEYVKNYKQVYNDVEKRKSIEYKKIILTNEISEMIETTKSWPVTEHEITKLQNDLNEVRNVLKKFKDDESRAEKFEGQRSLREKYLRVTRIFEDYNVEKDKLIKLQKVTRQDLDELMNSRRILDGLKAKIDALKLKIKLISKTNSVFKVGEGLDAEREINLSRGDSYEAYINGKFMLSTEDFDLNVYPGEDGSGNLLKKYETARKEYESLLVKSSVRDELELSKKAELYKNQFDRTKLLGETLKKELGDQTYSNLEAQYKSIEHMNIEIPLNEIIKLISVEQIKLNEIERDINDKKKLIDGWSKKYQTMDLLIERLSIEKNKLVELEADMNKSNPIPETYSDADEFIKDYESKSKLYDIKKEELTSLRIQRAELEKDQPEFSTKELKIKLKEAIEQFENVKREAESYLVIKEELDLILKEIDSETFIPLKREILSFLKQLTLNKYSDAVIEETIPTGIRQNGSSSIPVGLLSAGTKDILALAVRLGMANFYLNGRDGFIIMDDPLVNLDPDRQKAAADCIRKAAERKQIIILTCHPLHAKLFGGEIMELV